MTPVRFKNLFDHLESSPPLWRTLSWQQVSSQVAQWHLTALVLRVSLYLLRLSCSISPWLLVSGCHRLSSSLSDPNRGLSLYHRFTVVGRMSHTCCTALSDHSVGFLLHNLSDLVSQMGIYAHMRTRLRGSQDQRPEGRRTLLKGRHCSTLVLRTHTM